MSSKSSRVVAIDSAGDGEVEAIAKRCSDVEVLSIDTEEKDKAFERSIFLAPKDRATLLAIVQRQAGEIADMLRRPAESRALRAEIKRDAACVEVERLTERLRMMHHGEAEALKMMGAEKLRADRLAAEVERYSQRELAYTHINPPAEKLPAPLACPNCDCSDSWREFLGDSELMRCEKEEGGCGYSLSLDVNEPENLRQALDLLRAKVKQMTVGWERTQDQLATAESALIDTRETISRLQQEKTDANAKILRLRAESNKHRNTTEALNQQVNLLRKGLKLQRAVTFPGERQDDQSPGEARWSADEWIRKHGHLIVD